MGESVQQSNGKLGWMENVSVEPCDCTHTIICLVTPDVCCARSYVTDKPSIKPWANWTQVVKPFIQINKTNYKLLKVDKE